jgi:hypothetical protein
MTFARYDGERGKSARPLSSGRTVCEKKLLLRSFARVVICCDCSNRRRSESDGALLVKGWNRKTDWMVHVPLHCACNRLKLENVMIVLREAVYASNE